MPCTDGGIPYQEPTSKQRKKIQRIQLEEKVDYLTDLLCQAGRARYNNRERIPVEVLEWWQDHCEIDAERGEPW